MLNNCGECETKKLQNERRYNNKSNNNDRKLLWFGTYLFNIVIASLEMNFNKLSQVLCVLNLHKSSNRKII